jgi:hypothetical protein
MNRYTRRRKPAAPDLSKIRIEPTGKLLLLVVGLSLIGGMVGAALITLINH